MSPEARILPLDGGPLPVSVTVHTEGAADGNVTLKLPEGWRSEPAQATFRRSSAGDTEPIEFSVTRVIHHPRAGLAVQRASGCRSGGKTYMSGWRSVGYTGLRPYNFTEMPS